MSASFHSMSVWSWAFSRSTGSRSKKLNFAGGAKIAQAMTAGAVDISLSAGPDMQFVAKGAPEIAIGSIAEFPGFMAYVVAANSDIHSLDDLRGKKVGITSLGSLTDWLAEELDRVKGWTGEQERLTKVTVGGSTPAVIAALKTGQVDASITSAQLGLQLGENGEGKLLSDCSAYVGTIELYTMFASRADRRAQSRCGAALPQGLVRDGRFHEGS